MAILYAHITPQILIWARERISMPVDLAAKASKVSIEKYLSWEAGENRPTVIQAKKFAKTVKIPYVWLFLDTPPEKHKLPKSADYRTLGNRVIPKHSVKLQCLIADIAARREIMTELYTEMDIPIPRFEQYADANTSDDSSIVQMVRNLMDIPLAQDKKFKTSNDAFNYYREALSEKSILVFQAEKFEQTEIRGMTIYDPVFPIIVVNRKDEVNARIFTLAHELVHILTKTPGICNSFDIGLNNHFNIENICNRIAAEALVPQDELFTAFNWPQGKQFVLDDNIIRKIAGIFSVSREVIIGRLLVLKKISPDVYRKKLSQYTAEYTRNKKMQNPAKKGFVAPEKNIFSQVGKLYARTVISAYNQNTITPREASYCLSGLRIQHFEKLERLCIS
ncbi:MAG: ImmA/IrrE family metallo-endopeptidase [Spirochaetota bacterium]|nr:ImmA/IrrE family metallo-endopeptidase [Spirochaetota bacterium]